MVTTKHDDLSSPRAPHCDERSCLLRPTEDMGGMCAMLCGTHTPPTQNKQKYNKKDTFSLVVESIDMLKYVNLFVPKVSFTVSEFHNTNI